MLAHMDGWIRDLRYAARGLRRTPAFAAAAILTLAAGIGTTTAVFSVVYGVLLRPLPFPAADRLVRIVQLLPSRPGGEPGRSGLTQDQIAEWRATSRTLAEIGSYRGTSLSLTGVPQPIRLNGASISVPLFRALGVTPLAGRVFADDEELAGNERVVVLSHALWTARFGAAAEIVGRTLTLGGRDYRVIGVMPAGFGFPSLASPGMSMNADGDLSEAPEFWIPTVKAARPAGPATGGITLVPTYALLRPGVTAAQAAAEANTLMPARVKDRFTVEVTNPRSEETRRVRGVLLLFQAAVLFVLFIACANVTNLLLARAASRRHELTVRLALGASRLQVARHAIAEATILGVCGGAAGVALAYQTVALVRTLPPYVVPRLGEIRVDAAALGLTTIVAIGAGLAVGALTAIRILRSDGRGDWHGHGRGASPRHQPSRVLVMAETASGVMLLAGAVLLLGSFVRLARVDRGFDATGVYSFRDSRPQRLQPPAAQHVFHDRLTAALRAMPGVEATGIVEPTLVGAAIVFGVNVDGRERRDEVWVQTVTPGFIPSLRIPLRGRDFVAADRLGTPTAVIVNETFARKHFPGRDAIGQAIGVFDWPSLQIVGVVGDTRQDDLTGGARSAAFVPPQATAGLGSPTYVVRGGGRTEQRRGGKQ
jgi:predicted permease